MCILIITKEYEITNNDHKLHSLRCLDALHDHGLRWIEMALQDTRREHMA